ncbi:MAG: response regulator [Sphaerotilus natans subsp. sulfidivorans]|uniref:response regulator n=1 Tax=Sphaerotilus sulfidivorans TaxID=639200 RepID=UPI0023525689|nr:response regulator [Sphaerotilus sulfidivorans]MCK6400964.1 response regulator [Sphaerotilus sulfidivorans]
MSKLIFIVDNSSSMRRVMEIALTGAGYEVMEAADGRDALTKLAKLSGRRISLIVCAAVMPGMGGLELIEALKKESIYKLTPVVLLVTENSEAVQERARAVGNVKATIVKPFNPTQLITTVQKMALP